MVGDVDADVIAAYGRHLAMCGGRGGRPAALATVQAVAPELLLAAEIRSGSYASALTSCCQSSMI